MPDERIATPDETALRVALWRALHLHLDPAPHVFEDDIGLRIADPDPDWRDRPDMDPDLTRWFRAAIVARARFIDDLVIEQVERGAEQYLVLGAGLDTFVQRRPEVAARLRVFEVDQPGPQAWKRRRLDELGYGVPDRLHLVPVDFESGASWWDELTDAGFDPTRPTVVASTGVALYLTRQANADTLRRLASLAPGSTLAMTFQLPPELLDSDEHRAAFRIAIEGARAAGTPFVSFYSPEELPKSAREVGFATARHVSAAELNERYFAHRSDRLRTSSGEELLVATT